MDNNNGISFSIAFESLSFSVEQGKFEVKGLNSSYEVSESSIPQLFEIFQQLPELLKKIQDAQNTDDVPNVYVSEPIKWEEEPLVEFIGDDWELNINS